MSLPPWDGHATEPAQCGLLAYLVMCQKPEIVVEAGTYQGHAAHFMARSLQEIGSGHLHTADPFPMGQTRTLVELTKWVTVYKSDFLDMLATIPEVDFAYIDASANEPGGARLRWQHFKAVKAKLRPGGIICVDDTKADDWDDGENGRSAQRIRDACGLNFAFLRGLSIYSR